MGDAGYVHHRNFPNMIIANMVKVYPRGLQTRQPALAYELCTCGMNH